MSTKVLVTEHVIVPEWTKSVLEVKYVPEIWENREKLFAEISGYDGVIVRNRTDVNAELLSYGSQLKVIGRLGAGLDNVDMLEAKRRQITVVHTPDANTDAVAEYCLAQMIYATRKLHYADRSTHAGKWDRLGCIGREMKECVVGIVGYGHIVKRLIEILSSLSCQILIASRHKNSGGNENLKFVSLEELFEEADIISLHIEGGSSTQGYILGEHFERMKKDVVFLNTSRGDIIDEDVLEKAIVARPEGTFVLDVRKVESPADARFNNYSNVILSPHTAAFSKRAQDAVAESVFTDVSAVLSGKKPNYPAHSGHNCECE